MQPLVFPLKNQFQNYAWGKEGSSSLVYRLLHTSMNNPEELEINKPYAELWMGDHPNGPSQIIQENGITVSLKEEIEKSPSYFLGDAYNGREKRLPFLFKILSVGSLLSLQIHPNKHNAEILHKEQPDCFKDDNHKPEIVIALSDFEAFCNFRPFEDIKSVLENNKVIRELIGAEISEKFIQASYEDAQELLRNILYQILLREKNEIKLSIERLLAEINSKDIKDDRDELVLFIHKLYPDDAGIFISYFLNHCKLKSGESFIMNPEEPHAYIKGDCIECKKQEFFLFFRHGRFR